MHQPLLPYSPERDVYRLLGVPASASTSEIVAACRHLARTFHPDRNPSERATAEMQVVNTVRKVMSDPEMRALYDRERWRFHAFGSRPRARMPQPAPLERLETVSSLSRLLRAAIAGVRTTVSALLPARCVGCHAVLVGDDPYCAACGTPLLRGG